MDRLRTGSLVVTLVVFSVLQALAADAVPVTVDNFVRAESDLYLAGATKKFGFGKFGFESEMAPIDAQTVIRMNRDTLYVPRCSISTRGRSPSPCPIRASASCRCSSSTRTSTHPRSSTAPAATL